MKSLFLYLFATLVLIQLSSCQVKSLRKTDEPLNSKTQPLVDPKYSLTKDRSELDKIRESIPADKKKTNDEKALIAELFAEEKYEPEVIREKFDTLARKKRELFNKDMTQLREDYNKVERKKKEEFQKKLEESRTEFLNQKVDREKRADFFNDQDEQRRTYFAEQKDKREDFESDIREKRKNFEDYIKEKNDEFNSELKNYRLKLKEKNK